MSLDFLKICCFESIRNNIFYYVGEAIQKQINFGHLPKIVNTILEGWKNDKQKY